MRQGRRALIGTAGLGLLAAAGRTTLSSQGASAQAYQPQTRSMPIVIVPVLTHEQEASLNYLTAVFAKGAMLDGKEVFAFQPSFVSAYVGDSITFQVYNPTPDPHTLSFNALKQSVTVQAQSTGELALTALAQGIYDFQCLEEEHMPFM